MGLAHSSAGLVLNMEPPENPFHLQTLPFGVLNFSTPHTQPY